MLTGRQYISFHFAYKGLYLIKALAGQLASILMAYLYLFAFIISNQ